MPRTQDAGIGGSSPPIATNFCFKTSETARPVVGILVLAWDRLTLVWPPSGDDPCDRHIA